MTDWAKQKAQELFVMADTYAIETYADNYTGECTQEPESVRIAIEEALRKAKADGMNEIGDWISVTGSTEVRQYVRGIRDRAARVEQPR